MEENSALSKVKAICSKQEKCSFDIIKKLKEWEVQEDRVQKIINQLKKEGYLDDLRYARAFAHDKFRIAGWGKIKIRHHLLHKGLPEPLINESLDLINGDSYSKKLYDLLKRKALQIKTGNNREKKQKLMTFAYQRGFAFDDCYPVINQIVDKDSQDG